VTDPTAPAPAAPDPGVESAIRSLVASQPYGVLCTQGDAQPYGSLVALAAGDDLAAFVFATAVETRKYRLLAACDRVALVLDTRSASGTALMDVEALTVTGRAVVVVPGPDRDRWGGLLVARHPALADFVRSPGTAVVRVDVDLCVHVSRFQAVRTWSPPGRGAPGPS
jgi:hypothetical protein